MKRILSLCFIAAIISCSDPKINSADGTSTAANEGAAGGDYQFALSFNSICCGTPSADFVKTFVRNFNQDNNYNVSVDIAGGCGKEGEFDLLFNLPSNAALNNQFITALTMLATQTNDSNKKASTSSGGINVLSKAAAGDYQHCRLGIKPWPLQ